MPAHPRSRGENSRRIARPASGRGSSPLTRGKLGAHDDALGDGGLIPAHAGKTRYICEHLNKCGAHPRSRGENALKRLNEETKTGSSPLTRGKPVTFSQCSRTRGLIPAHAGKTWRSRTRAVSARAHPRSRGENYFCRPMSHENEGSSPLTRGKLIKAKGATIWLGLIPAHAGKTGDGIPWSRLGGAHPRSRGENASRTSSRSSLKGSSPLTRGKRSRLPRRRAGTGLIPAHAGKTDTRAKAPSSSAAHPRSRGENHCRERVRGRRRGSSPLTRGKRVLEVRGRRAIGLIPAHAGKTSPSSAQIV